MSSECTASVGSPTQHRRHVRVAHLLAQLGRQLEVGRPRSLPLHGGVLVAVRADVVPRHEHPIGTEQLADPASHPIDVGDMVHRGVVDDEVEVLVGEVGDGSCRGGRSVSGRSAAAASRRAWSSSSSDTSTPTADADHPFADEVALDPAVAAVQHERMAERAVVVAQVLRPRSARDRPVARSLSVRTTRSRSFQYRPR